MEVRRMNKLKVMRKQRNLTVEEVAKAIGITQPALSMIENGHRNPSMNVAFKLADFFNVKVEDLFSQPKDITKKKTPAGV